MKTSAFLHSVRRPLLACASLLGLATALNAADKEPVYENYIELGTGSALQDGDRAGFQRAFQVRKEGYFGIEDLRYAKQINDSTSLKLRGQAMAGNGDYLFDLTVTKDEVGYVKFGYKQTRVHYDGTGGVWPTNGKTFTIADEEMAIDRGNLWLELGLTKPDLPSFVLRYDYVTREGDKDSTAWADGRVVEPNVNRYIIPAFMRIDEKKHIIQGTASKRGDKNEWMIGARYEKGEYDNGRYARRRYGEVAADRYVTSKEGQDYDMLHFRGSYAVDLTEQIKLTTAVARTTIDTTLSGSRVVGANWDASFSENYPGKQQRDEGYFALPGHELGESEMTQTIANLSLMYRPLEHLTIVPAMRFEKTEWSNVAEMIETNFNPVTVTIIDELESESDKDWKTYNYGLEMRYTGVKNFNFNFRADISNSDGRLEETELVEPGTPLQSTRVDRDTEMSRKTQKYAFTTSWYARPGLSVAAQYYYKVRQNDFDAVRDTTPNGLTSSDRYPAYISNQDLETNDFNIRLSWRILPTLRSVTRYDYMKSTTMTQEFATAFFESMNVTQHIYSESLSWNPTPRWFVQANVNLVDEELVTPAVYATGASANIVTASLGDYLSYNISSGYALDDQSDLYVDYTSYGARDTFINNAPAYTPYGTDVQTDIASVTYKRKLDRRTTIVVKYTYAKSEDSAYLGKADYEANMLQAKLLYRF